MYHFRNAPPQTSVKLPVEPIVKIDREKLTELKFWSQELNVHHRTLDEAIKAVGPFLKDVKKHLGIV